MPGDHWEAIDGDAQRTVEKLMPKAAQGGRVHGQHQFDRVGEDGRTRRETAWGLVFGEQPVGFFTLVVSDSMGKRKCVHSAYPICREGMPQDLIVDGVSPRDEGLEGVIRATTPERMVIWFFDPFFYANRELYRVGQGCRVTFGALAMRLEKAQLQEFEITEGPRVELTRARVGRIRKRPSTGPRCRFRARRSASRAASGRTREHFGEWPRKWAASNSRVGRSGGSGRR